MTDPIPPVPSPWQEPAPGATPDPAALLAAGVTATPSRPRWTAPAATELATHFSGLTIEALIGQGGMGAVYRVRQPHLDRVAALKVLPAGSDLAFVERFQREARVLARLAHPNLVTVYDVGVAGPWCWLLMEHVEGANLRQVLASGRVTAPAALALVPQLCDALQYAHDQGVVHRDLKPENILVDERGRLKLADFGLAKIAVGPAEPAAPTLTGSNDLLGTPHYMAPEQVERSRDVDHRADLYALGVVLYEMLTGGLPLGRFAPPSQQPGVDPRVDAVVHKSLEKDPERRYQRADELKEDMARIAGGGQPIAAGDSGDGNHHAAERLAAILAGVLLLLAPAYLRLHDVLPLLTFIAAFLLLFSAWSARRIPFATAIPARDRALACWGLGIGGIALVISREWLGMTMGVVLLALLWRQVVQRPPGAALRSFPPPRPEPAAAGGPAVAKPKPRKGLMAEFFDGITGLIVICGLLALLFFWLAPQTAERVLPGFALHATAAAPTSWSNANDTVRALRRAQLALRAQIGHGWISGMPMPGLTPDGHHGNDAFRTLEQDLGALQEIVHAAEDRGTVPDRARVLALLRRSDEALLLVAGRAANRGQLEQGDGSQHLAQLRSGLDWLLAHVDELGAIDAEALARLQRATPMLRPRLETALDRLVLSPAQAETLLNTVLDENGFRDENRFEAATYAQLCERLRARVTDPQRFVPPAYYATKQVRSASALPALEGPEPSPAETQPPR